MIKMVVSLAAAGAALAAATPASAQYYPQAQPYGYGNNGYGNNGYGNNGYGNNGYGNFGEVRSLQAQIDRVQYQIRMLDRRDVIRGRDADRLNDEARRLERQLHRAARYGLNPYQANEIRARVAQLENQVQYASANRYGRYGHDHDRNGDYGDRDRGYDRNDNRD